MIKSNDVLKEIDDGAKKIVDERDPVYGDSWQRMLLIDIIYEIKQKADRVTFMPDGPAKYDQALDIINYARFLAWRLKNDK